MANEQNSIKKGEGIKRKDSSALTLRYLMNWGANNPKLLDLPIEHSDPEGNFPKEVLVASYVDNENGKPVVWIIG